jgi:hypothetical protein
MKLGSVGWFARYHYFSIAEIKMDKQLLNQSSSLSKWRWWELMSWLRGGVVLVGMVGIVEE